jgi:CBS domain-containing protein
VLEIFREDIARFRTLIAIESDEDPMQVLAAGGVPLLRALRLHNGTIYRWNRPCYGISEGKAHLRIENRVMPAGPSVIDEIANAAFYVGLMCSSEEFGDVTRLIGFDDARANFVAAARYGLHARFRWIKGKAWTADQLVLEQLLPLARNGLEKHGVANSDIDFYTGVIEERVRRDRTGAQWSLDSLSRMDDRARPMDRYRALTAALVERQKKGAPVHEWQLAAFAEQETTNIPYRVVGQLMTRDLFTVRPDDVVDLAVSLMEWQHIRHVPVEDEEGRLVGLLSLRSLLRLMVRGLKGEGANKAVAVRDVMRTQLVTVAPETPIKDAIDQMRRNKVGCLPVVKDGRLVGIVTEHDFIELSAVLLDRWLEES